ncbi:tetratricopeptide repeat protein [Flavobacterium litorale]|uniref:Tetratricopeptide repeat protein n=1 Tax=Flavobacterium litorale TaxID=2856519 RepID=A0ABX8V488_9FLAO|nr:tetratricopeptide repeat protein [Flavobacterium litorale]QYJ67625.1 tetratricopeptide repeat protein [Flavobacterium litorale]
MKKFAIAASLLLSISTFAQKDELKALKKLSKKVENMMDKRQNPSPEIYQEAKQLLAAAEATLPNATEKQEAEYYYYKGGFEILTMNIGKSIESLNKVIEIEKASNNEKYTDEIQNEMFPMLKSIVANQAKLLGQQQKYKEAYPLYEQIYRLSPKDTVQLYNAAAYAVNSQQYADALKYYEELQELGFTGISINYTARDIEKDEVQYFGDKKVRDLYVANKTHDQPGVYREESKKGDIVKNIALIYINQGEKEKAMAALAEAKKENPNDTALLLAESQIYLEAGDYENYKKAVTAVLNLGSKDPNLYFNLGVTTSKSGQAKDAMLYYKKAIELKPDFWQAYQNLGILQLDGEDALVKEMNSLGNSSKEMKRYDELKKERDNMYKEAVVYLEKAHEIKPDNKDIRSILATLYQGLEMMDKYKAIKAE